MKKILLALLIVLIFTSQATALNLSRVKTWSAEVLTHTDLNAEFDNILNHSITNSDISATAAIVASKIDFTVSSAIGSTTPSTGAFTTLSTTGDLSIGEDDTIIFEGATADAYETTLTVADPGADITITIPALTGTVVTSAGIGANIDVGAYEIRAQTFESDVTTGTAPFTIASTTKSTNLNADLLDGYNTATSAAANVIYRCGADNYMPDDTVDTTALKTTSGAVSITSATAAAQTLPGGAYGFYPQTKMEDTNTRSWRASVLLSTGAATTMAGWTTYATKIVLQSPAGGEEVFAQQTYVTASGTDHWIFLLVDKSGGDIISKYEAPDHPSYGNGGDAEQLPHPFTDYYDGTKHSIILVDKEIAKDLRQEAKNSNIGILSLISKKYKPNFAETETYQPMHSGKFLGQEPIIIESIPDYIKVRKLLVLTAQDKADKEAKRQQKEAERLQKEQEKENEIALLKTKLNLTSKEWELLKGEQN